MNNIKIDLNISSDTLAQFQAISEGCNRPLDWVLRRALETYLLNEGGDILSSIEGKNQIKRGEFELIDDVLADLEQLIK